MELTADAVPMDLLTVGTFVLIQMEVSIQANIEIVEKARSKDCKVIFNLAPASKIPTEMLKNVDYLIVNIHEARTTLEECFEIKAGDMTPESLSSELAKAGRLICIITLGKDGSIAATPEGQLIKVSAPIGLSIKDSTGAGDCYCGYFVAALADGTDLGTAMKRACVAASMSCCKQGIHTAYPSRDEVMHFLDSEAC